MIFDSSLVRIEAKDFPQTDTLWIQNGDSVYLRHGLYRFTFTNDGMDDINVYKSFTGKGSASSLSIGAYAGSSRKVGSSYVGLLRDVNLVVRTDSVTEVKINGVSLGTGSVALKLPGQTTYIVETSNALGSKKQQVKLDKFTTFKQVDLPVNPSRPQTILETIIPGTWNLATGKPLIGAAKLVALGYLGYSALNFKQEHDILLAQHKRAYSRYLNTSDESAIPGLWEDSEQLRKDANAELRNSYVFGAAFMGIYAVNAFFAWKRFNKAPRRELPLNLKLIPKVDRSNGALNLGGSLRASF